MQHLQIRTQKMIDFIKNHKLYFVSTLIIFALFLLYNSKLVLNLSTALTDWYDYPLMVYVQQQNISHLSTLDFANYDNITMYSDSPGGMYFTDLLLPQSVLGLLLFPLTENYITTHNLVFILVGLLNIISLHYFWSIIFKKKQVIFLLSLFFTFSPYTFGMYAHYQMISYWFFFFSLGALLRAKNSKHYFISGCLSGLQFLAAVYLGIYSLTISGLFFIWHLYQKKKLKVTIQIGAVFLLGFLVVAGYFALKFALVQRAYGITRPAEEYVNHSMQITDFFFNPLPSLWTETFYKYVNVHNHRLGGETFGPGFILLGIVIFGVFQLKKTKLEKRQQFMKGFMLLMFAWGMIAILGPRLSINGRYLALPLPYIFPLKLTPLFTALRVISRWFFLVQIGLLYFSGFTFTHIFNKYKQKKAYLIIFFLLAVYVIEIVPIKQRTTIDTYKSPDYSPIISLCTQEQVVLEYPFAPEQPDTHVLITLNYWVKMILNLMHYDCQLVNGYSGYQPKHVDDFIHFFRLAVENSESETIHTMLKNKNVTYIKFNKNMMLEESILNVQRLFKTDSYKVLLDSSDSFIIMVK